jgi:hypothetical protein
VDFKRHNPNSNEIELALKAFSMVPAKLTGSVRNHSDKASHILGIFRHNFAPLNLRVNTHFPPAEENCSEGTFREIFYHLMEEQKAIVQWGLCFPERATACYQIPLDDIDLYNAHRNEWPKSEALERCIFNTFLKLRTY